jgi:hypothetical protein
LKVTISTNYLAEHLAAVLDQIQERGDSFVIHHNWETIGRLEPVARQPDITACELIARVGNLQTPGEGLADDFEAAKAEQGMAAMIDWPD